MALKLNWEDRLLGMRAVEKRFITEKQLTKCLNLIEFNNPAKALSDMLLEEGLLTAAQLKRLREDMLKETSSVDEGSSSNAKKMFGEIALEQNMVTRDQLDETLAEQDKYMQRGLRVQIGQILYKKGYLTLPQVSRIVEGQSKKSLYCKNCQITTVIHNYEPSRIYQCEKCTWDLIEAKAPKKQEAVVAEDGQDDEHEEGLGKLDILEL
jgi:ribosomal protein L37AE/L43A/polyhydroxyalkanoate synthesis regulator phasin